MTAEKLHDALTLLPADLIAEADKKRCKKQKRIPWKRYTSMAACLALLLCGTWFFSRLLSPKSSANITCGLPMYESMTEAGEAPMEYEQAAPAAAEGFRASGSSNFNAVETQCADAPAEDICGLPTTESASKEETETTEGTIFCDYFLTPNEPLSAVNTADTGAALICSRAELEAYWQTHSCLYDFTSMRSGCDAYDDAWFETNDMLLIHALSDSAATTWEITQFSELGEHGWEWEILLASHTITTPDSAPTSFHLLTGVEKGLISPEDDILTVQDTLNSTVTSDPFCE